MTGQIDFGGFTAYNSTTPINDSDLSPKSNADDLITNIDDIAISSLNTSQSFPNISMSSASDITFNGGYINDVSGIGLSDASPDSTDGILYNDSGALKFNGRSISRPFYDAEIYISGSTAYCIDEDGLIVNSSLFHNRVFSYAIAHYDNIRVVSGNYYFNSTLNTSNAEFTMYLDPNAIIHKGDGLSNAIIHFYGAASYPLIIGGK